MSAQARQTRFSDLPLPWFAAAALMVAVLQIALILRHDYFVDEWQALQIAVQSPDLPALLGNLRYEGHPPLWYLLLRGLAAIVGPGHALAAASLLCALSTLAIIVWRAPLPRWARLMLILGEPLLFEFGTVSRGYSLGVTLTFAALACWHRRGFWVMLALLPLVDFLLGLVAIALLGLRYAEGGRAAIPAAGAALFVLASAAAAWSVIPAADFISVYRPTGMVEELTRWASQMAVVTLPVQWDGRPHWNAVWQTPLTPILGLAFLAIAYDQTRGWPAERAVAIGFPLVLLGFMLLVHTLAIRHLMLCAVVFAAVLWRQAGAGVPLRKATCVWLVAGALCGIGTAWFALTRPFDAAPRVARAIVAADLQREAWLSFPAQHAQGVAALTGIGFEAVERRCRQDFVRWNFRHQVTDAVLLRDWLVREGAGGGGFHLLTQHEPAPHPAIVRLATIPAGLDGKVYHLYRIVGARPGRRATPTPCVPGTRPLAPLLRE